MDRSPDKPELLAPAGDFEAMRAAVANGADAVYFGLSQFNARHRATNFTLEELPRVVRYLHDHNVRGYVTLNTLIFSDELPDAAAFVTAIAEAGVDAVIVQDLGLARLIARIAPSLAVHGSTQMTLTEPLGIAFVRELGVRRVVLARELSTADIRRITQTIDLPVEVFAHGALCVSYSGQCLTSEAIGGRSANRGQCAQACRLPYDLIVDGERRDLGDKAYLLSPQDLATFDIVDELASAGVRSLKIEGRLKSPAYVAATTQSYRAAIDALGDARPFVLAPEQALAMAQSFSRGFTHGFLDGVNHQSLVHARFPKSRGVRIGRVERVTDRAVIVRPERARAAASNHRARGGSLGFATGSLRVGDGVVFDEGHPEQDEQGGRVAAVRELSSARNRQEMPLLEVTFDRFGLNPAAVTPGAIVWKTDDPAVRRQLSASYQREKVVRRSPIDASIRAEVGSPLTIDVTDATGRVVTVCWDQPLQPALKFPLTEAGFREQFGRLGDTPFELRNVAGLESPSPAMAPKSVLNDLRRQAVEQLLALRVGTQTHRVAETNVLGDMRAEVASLAAGIAAPPTTSTEVSPAAPRLHVLVRSMAQLRAVAHGPVRPATVYCDFEDIRQYKEAVSTARSAGVPVGLATVRVIKPHEEGLLRQLAACEPDLLLIRNLAALGYYSRHAPVIPLVADYALNVANELTAGLLIEKNVLRIVPSYDLNWSQMSAMFQRVSATYFETVIHQHMPMFHMEHCVFCHTLSTGTSHKDCGRPCDVHRVDLKDRVGVSNPLVADVGCRNTVYNGVAQTAADYVPQMRELGLREFRIELLRETSDEAVARVAQYDRIIRGEEDGRTAWRRLKVLSQLGVTRGTLVE